MQKILNFFKTKNSPVWEYKVIPVLGDEDDNFVEYEMVLNHLGEIGWELVCTYNKNLIFKKPCSNKTK
jgi:hypothetical protein